MIKIGKIFEKKMRDNPFIYHYTSVDSLLSILEGYRKSELTRKHGQEDLLFWASCVYNSNDPREMEFGYKAVKEILPEYENTCTNSMNLSEVYSNAEYEKECKKLLFQKPINGMIGISGVPYTISLSCKRDFLPMWSMYGDNKMGACLKFNLNNFIDNFKAFMHPCFVYYEGEEENIIKDHLLPILYEGEVLFTDRENKGISMPMV